MSWGDGAYKVIGAKQCSSMGKEVSMATLLVVPTQTSTSFGAWKVTIRVKWGLWFQQPQAPEAAGTVQNKPKTYLSKKRGWQ